MISGTISEVFIDNGEEYKLVKSVSMRKILQMIRWLYSLQERSQAMGLSVKLGISSKFMIRE